MKRVFLLLTVTLFLGACATAQPTMRTTYGLDSAGNLVERQQLVAAPESANIKLLETAAIVGLGLVGLYFVGEVFDVWDNDDPAPAPAQGPFVLPAGGTSHTEYSNSFILPDYQVVN